MTDGSVTIGITTHKASISATPADVIRSLRVSNDLAQVERAQISEWIAERFDDLYVPIENSAEFIQAIHAAFAGELSPDKLQALINMAEAVLK